MLTKGFAGSLLRTLPRVTLTVPILVSGVLANSQTASAAIAFSPLGSGYTDPSFNAAKAASTPSAPFEENWVTELRGGGPATYEQSINNWPNNTTGIFGAVQGPSITWVSGRTYNFETLYDPALNPQITFKITDPTNSTSQTITSPLSPPGTNFTRSPAINALYLRTAAAFQSGTTTAASTTISNLIMNSASYAGTLNSTATSTTTQADYLAITGFSGPFKLNGDIVFNWAGTFPTQSRLDFTVKAMYTAAAPSSSVPGPLPVLGAAAAFGYSRKLRKRIHQARRTPQATV